MEYSINILGNKFTIIDSLEYVTLADSFVKNKIGTGHGEAKLYVGNESDRLIEFFDNSHGNAFFLKADFEKYLLDAEQEFLFPQQEYVHIVRMSQIYQELKERVSSIKSDILGFNFYRVNVTPPRVYINSKSEYYYYMRKLGLPNISYASILKLQDNELNIYYYFKMFIDYKSDIIKYITLEEREQEEHIIEDSSKTSKQKTTLIQSRVGQGDYREKLISECTFCPFTDVNDERLLIASHIKPWAKSNDKEKIDPKNGFVFTPTYDKLFDKGFISFSDMKELQVSPWISPMNQKRLGIYNGKVISKLPLDKERTQYLEYHRENVFKK